VDGRQRLGRDRDDVPVGRDSRVGHGATLSFWVRIATAGTTTTTAYDTLKVEVRSSTGTLLATLATYSNLNKSTTYSQKSFNLTAYKGQTVRVQLVAKEDSSLATSFVVDDTALNVQ
jgi:hypothetical protein